MKTIKAFTLVGVLLLIPIIACAGDGESSGTVNRMLSFGLSMGASWLMGAVQKRTIPKQQVRNAIPATNSVLTGGTAGLVTSDPVSMLAAVFGSLAASGVHKVAKRVKKGRW